MSLTKLFQRRNSSQKDRKKSLTSAELSASDSTAEEFSAKKEQVQTATDSENCCSEDMRESRTSFEETKKSSNIERELDDRYEETFESTAPSEASRRNSVRETSDFTEQVRNKSRSHSLKESGTKMNAPRIRRRKCESESSAFGFTDDEGFGDKIIQLKERDLEKVIGQCVDKLIRESILTAVKSVKIDDLYEDVLQSLGRSASESSESSGGQETVEQKLHTDSVTEFVDFQMMHTFEEEKVGDEESDDSNQQREFESSSEVSEELQSNVQSRDDNKDSTEIEEGLTCPESDSTSASKIVDPKTSEPENCSNSIIHLKTNVKDSVENCESSAYLNQNENILTKVSGSKQLDRFAESARINIKNKDLHENDIHVRTKNVKKCQEPEILNGTEENGTADDTMNRSRREMGHTSQAESNGIGDDQSDETDVEEVKDISAEGYRADIEESISLHSLASESSFENVKDGKICSRTTSDDAVASADEDNPGEPKKDIEDSPQLDDVKVLNVEADLMALSGDDFSHLLTSEPSTPASDLGENLLEQKPAEVAKRVNWKAGYLHVKLPHKSRHKGLKVWKKRCVAIQPDEFDCDPCLVLSVYSGDSSAAKKHSASFWKSVSCQKAVIYRSSSRTHPHAFTVSDDQKAVIHLAADSEAIAQEWMAAVRAILWPPSPVVQLEKMLNGREFEVSIIDNDFSYRAGLLGMYGYLTITPKKLILVHPQQGFVIQEWYLNTIDKFQLIPQTRIEDVNKVLSMTTCSDSSTGKGDLMVFCKEAVSLLQAVASTIHQILAHHSKQEGGKYRKELEEIGAWLVTDATATEDYYQVPPRQVKSLLDIPNFIFSKPHTPDVAVDLQKSLLGAHPTRASGISSDTVADDCLNCSITSFVVGGGRFPGKSSDSELSDTYTPPRSPEVKNRREAHISEGTADA